MKQTRAISLIEAVVNITSGLLISAVVWMTIGPMFGYYVTWSIAIGFSSVFTIVSIIRSYLWRRWFENRLNGWLHKKLYGDDDATL